MTAKLQTVLAALAVSLLLPCWGGAALAADATDRVLAHDVYFTLKEHTPAAREKLVAECKKYLTDHPGTVYFATGTIGDEFTGQFNDRDYDVSLQLFFKDKAAHDTYVKNERHLKFVDENKESWTKVRVFDSWVSGAAKKTAEAQPQPAPRRTRVARRLFSGR